MQRTHRIAWIGAFCPVIAIAAVILWQNNGLFIYALDDPYIHLAVTETLLAGGYGIDTDEFTSPASSLLWPFLLLPFEVLGVGAYGPLILNLIAYGLSTALLLRRLPSSYGRYKPLVLWLLLIAGNSIGLVFIGLEHSWQQLLALFIISEILLYPRKPLSPWLPVALIIAPWIRYEMLCVTGASIAMLLYYRHYRYLLYGLISACGLVAFSLFLYHHTGQYLPASALLKITEPYPNNAIAAANFILLTALALLLLKRAKPAHASATCLYLLAIAAAHLFIGKFGWFSRYEAYLVLPLLFTLALFLPANHGKQAFLGGYRIILPAFFSLCYYGWYVTSTANASHSIYAQQVQMRRIHDALGNPPLAANDIGYLAYRNSGKIIDLMGLASNTIFQIRLSDQNASLVSQYADQQGAAIAMLYDEVWPRHRLPQHWVKIGELHYQPSSRFLASSVSAHQVHIYAVHAANAAHFNQTIQSLTLPKATHYHSFYNR